MQKRQLDVEALFSENPSGRYFYGNGWNGRALVAVALAALFSVGTVWLPALQSLSGFGWLIGAFLGGLLYVILNKRS